MPLTVAAGIPKAPKLIEATVGKVRNTIADYKEFAEGGWHKDALESVTEREQFMQGQNFKQLIVKEVVNVLKKTKAKEVAKTTKASGKEGVTPLKKSSKATTSAPEKKKKSSG
eukprot:10137-Heterococcus_DN1.PRE.2